MLYMKSIMAYVHSFNANEKQAWKINWIAQDEDGEWWGHTNKPTLHFDTLTKQQYWWDGYSDYKAPLAMKKKRPGQYKTSCKEIK
jgi:hypothetical protein